MSAGGLSYDCLVTSRKVTLPSVEMWGTNMNILQDPPTSVYTRRKDKVGDTQQILLAQEASGDRIAECINVYARGVNPMVSVSYDNNSNNAGSRGSIVSNFNTSVKLPYKPEVFHPPVFRQEDLMPLSRQPRNWFYALANPEIPNVVHQMSCPETRSAVWESSRVLHADAEARIQYNNEAPLTNSDLPRTHSTLRQEELTPDRLFFTQPQREEQVWMQGDHSCKSIQDNKMLYQAFSNKSGNRNLRDAKDLVEKIQTRALHLDVPVHEVVLNPRYYDARGMDVSETSFRKALHDQPLTYQGGSNPSGRFVQDVQQDNPLQKNESSHPFLYKEVQTKPGQTYYWKQAEGQAVGANPKTYHENIAHTEVMASPQMGQLEKVISHTRLAKEPSRELPLFQAETNKTGPYTHSNVQPDAMGGGRIEKEVRHAAVEAPRSVPFSATDVHKFQNVAVSVRDDPLRTSVTSVASRNTTSLKDILYHDTVEPSTRLNLPMTEAYSHKTFFDQNGEMGTMELNAKRIPHMETSTARDTSAMGHDLYGIQSTDGSKNISHAPSAGSMDGRPSNMPQWHRQYENGSERPVLPHRNVQNRASAQYFERFSNPPKN